MARRPTPLAALAALLVAAIGLGAGPAAAHPFLSAYRWVVPPVGAPAAGEPLARTLDIPASPAAVLPTEVWTGDLQAVLDLDETPLPADAGRTAVVVVLAPHAAEAVASLPRDLFPAGNAYEVRVTEPSGDPVDIEVPGRVLLATAHPDVRVLFSADGSSWREAPVAEAIPTQVTATFAASGYYVPVVDHDPAARAAGGGIPVLLVIGALAAAGTLWFGAARLRRR